MMEALDKELQELRDEIQPVVVELDKLRRELQAIDMPDHARGGPYVHPHGDDPPEAVAARRRVVVAAIEALEAAVKAQEQKMIEAARRHADELEHDPHMLDDMIGALYRNAGMRRPPLAQASMVLSEARYGNTRIRWRPAAQRRPTSPSAASGTALRPWPTGWRRRKGRRRRRRPQPGRQPARGLSIPTAGRCDGSLSSPARRRSWSRPKWPSHRNC